MNHNTSKPLFPPPPALPRFELPLEGLFDSADDPFDVAVTTQRPTLDAARALRVLRPGPRITHGPRPQVDATSEVQVEDILLEVYAEEPPPKTRRSSGLLSTAGAASLLPAAAPTVPAHMSIANAIVTALPATPPAPAESAAVDALLRASDPAFLPFGGHGHVAARPITPFGGFAPPAPLPVVPVHSAYSAYAAYGRPMDHDEESPSVAPVAFPSAHMPAAAHGPAPQPYRAVHVAPLPKRAGRGAAIAIGSFVLVALGLGTGLGVTVGVRNGTFAELRDRAKALTSHGESPKAAAATTAPIDPPASQVVVAPVPTTPVPTTPVAVAPAASAAPPAVTPTISVNALPAQIIAPDAALVTFPPSAQGHRVFFDGRPMAVTPEPMTLRCGRHMIRIGSSGRPRVTDLACGVPVTLR